MCIDVVFGAFEGAQLLFLTRYSGVSDAHASASFLVCKARRRRYCAKRSRIRSECSKHRTTMTMALKAGVAEEETPRNTTVLSKVAIRSAPTALPPDRKSVV